MTSQSHRKLRAAVVVCAVVVVTGPVPAAARAADLPVAAPAVAAPSPDPFSGLTAREIGDRAVTATRSATSLRMTGRIVSEGQPLDIDFAVDDRDECTGLMKVEDGTAELRRVDHVTYMKGDEAFWRASMTSQGMSEAQITTVLELIEDRWLKIAPGQTGSQDLGGVCDLKSLLAGLGKDKERRGGLARGPDGKVDGTPVATLVKKEAGGETTTVSVSERGEPYILKMVREGGKEPGALVLSDYDEPVDVKAPPPDETVDLAKLDRGTSA
ncbi:lipoprotein [Streptomyces litmocidini]|uniref:hypothetical protein n=1 Tax=Streptomyces litmocidini TaxID=67318 RepID=UPI00167EB28F|nr:hypothetical protein [Streptomyces litmocidini]GGU72202.1 lipoprotein [Streptomyces litmocidini]